MPDGHDKVAAVVRAAECWALDGDNLIENLRTEIEHAAAAHKAAEDADYAARRDAHRRDWTGRGFRPDPNICADIEREWREWISDVA